MTTLHLPSRKTKRPKEVDWLELAVRLDGRPVPGLRMTEAEFEAWCPGEVRSEWVDGEVILMPPVNLEHAGLFGWVYRLLAEFVEHHALGTVLGSEFQVRLGRQRRRRVPDILFASQARLRLLHPTYFDGAPDLAVEIVSPDSQSRDRREKYREYERAGVKEYWIIDPLSRRVEAYHLGRNRLFLEVDEVEGRIASTVLAGFYLRPDWLWRDPLPRVRTVLRELGVRD